MTDITYVLGLCSDTVYFVSAKVLLVGRVVFQVFSRPKVAWDAVEQVLGQHTEFIKSSDCKCSCRL